MRRMVEGSPASRPPSGLAPRSAALVLAVAPWAGAAGDGPELSPPADMPASARPAAPARARTPTASPDRGRAVLALPGITTPAGRSPGVITSTPSEAAEPLLPPDELTLDGPIEMRNVPPAPRPGPATGRAGRPSELGPAPMDDDPLPEGPIGRATPSPRRSTSTRPEPTPPAPTRRGRFFGLGPAPAASSPRPGRAVAEDAPDDPAADSALKRRIEKQAREAVGDRARVLEVRVSGKAASIQARGIRLLQKRNVRKALESLPALSGLRSTIDVGD